MCVCPNWLSILIMIYHFTCTESSTLVHVQCTFNYVLFSTDTGRIYKVAMASKASEYPSERRLGLDGLSHDPVVSQEWEV